MVRWKQDGTQNVVSSSQLKWEGALRKGAEVIMEWEGVPWYGDVLDAEDLEDSESSDDDFDVPLALLRDRHTGRRLI